MATQNALNLEIYLLQILFEVILIVTDVLMFRVSCFSANFTCTFKRCANVVLVP